MFQKAETCWRTVSSVDRHALFLALGAKSPFSCQSFRKYYVYYVYITLLYMEGDLFQNNHVSFTPLLIIPLLSAALKDSHLFSHLSLYRCRRFNNQGRFFLSFLSFLIFCLRLRLPPGVVSHYWLLTNQSWRWDRDDSPSKDAAGRHKRTQRDGRRGKPGGDGPVWWRGAAGSVGPR